MRIDKLSNGHPTLFIILNMKKLNRQCKKYDVCINSAFFYSIGINNLINFAKVKYREITFTSLHTKKIKNWWNPSKNLFSGCLDLTESFAFIILQFIKTFSYLKINNINLHQEEYTNVLIRYSDTIINYFRSKIENNIFIIKEENKIKKRNYI